MEMEGAELSQPQVEVEEEEEEEEEEDTTTVLNSQNIPPDILIHIFQYLPTADLVFCRLVSRSWSRIGTFLYGRRYDNKKTVYYDSENKCYMKIHAKKKPNCFQSLSEFLLMLKQATSTRALLNLDTDLDLLFTGFKFQLPLQQNEGDMKEFLDFYGSHVRHLSVGCFPNTAKYNAMAKHLGQLLFTKMPNVVQLTLDSELTKSTSSQFLSFQQSSTKASELNSTGPERASI